MITGVPPGRYVLHAWHERANEALEREVEVTAGGATQMALELDAGGDRWQPHLDKYGRLYDLRRRY